MTSFTALLIVVLTSLVARGIGGSVLVRDDTPHPLTDFTWRGQVINGGPIVEYSGRSFSHIKRQVAMDVPGFTWNSTWESQNHATNGSHTEMILGMETPQCRITGGHRPCDPTAINDGADYLEVKRGDCGIEGKSCSRISCSENSGIYYCNDNAARIWVACRSLGNNARYIGEKCTDVSGMGATGVAGQMFNTDGWNNFVGATTAEEGEC